MFRKIVYYEYVCMQVVSDITEEHMANYVTTFGNYSYSLTN